MITQCVGPRRRRSIVRQLAPTPMSIGTGRRYADTASLAHRQTTQFIECYSGGTAGLGVVHNHVVPTWTRCIEPVANQMEITNLRMTYVQDSTAVTHTRVAPQFAKTRADCGQLSCEGPQAGVFRRTEAAVFAQSTDRGIGRLVPINVELPGSGV